MRAVLREALGQAERWGLVTRNVARLAEPPRVPRHEIRPLSPDQARVFREAIRVTVRRRLFVALGVGLRQGEILGLGWDDIDLDAGTFTVRHAMQRVDGSFSLSNRSQRQPPGCRYAGLRSRASGPTAPASCEERLLAGSRWHADPRDLVFTTTVGTPMDGIAVTRRFQALLPRRGCRASASTTCGTPAPRSCWPGASHRGW